MPLRSVSVFKNKMTGFYSRSFLGSTACFKGITAGFAAAICGAVSDLYLTCSADVVGCVVDAVLYAAVNAAFCFTVIRHFIHFLSGFVSLYYYVLFF